MSYKEKRNLFIFGFCIGVIIFLTVIKLGYAKVDKVVWCHTEPNGNSQTLELPLAALQNAGHVDANGNPLHAGDYAGECEEEEVEPTPTPTPCIRITPTVTPTPEPEEEITPTVTVAPTVTPTEAPKTGGWSPQPEVFTDGRHTKDDGLGCGAHECKAEVLHSCDIPGNCGWK